MGLFLKRRYNTTERVVNKTQLLNSSGITNALIVTAIERVFGEN